MRKSHFFTFPSNEIRERDKILGRFSVVFIWNPTLLHVCVPELRIYEVEKTGKILKDGIYRVVEIVELRGYDGKHWEQRKFIKIDDGVYVELYAADFLEQLMFPGSEDHI